MRKALPIICIVAFIIGCATGPTQTRPNVSAIYRISTLKDQLEPLPPESQPLSQEPLAAEIEALFLELYNIDPVLASETGRIPEFQSSVGKRQILALNRFINLVKEVEPKKKAHLAELLKVGKAEFRRYSSPLQAVLWILEREKPKTQYTSQELDCFQADGIDYSIKINPLHYYLTELLAQAWDFSEKHRWKDFAIVTERLNAPELINYYQRTRFRYDWEGEVWRVLGGDHNRPGSPRYLFRHNEATCRDFAAFSAYCLKKGGYQAKVHLVENPDPRPIARGTKHRICLFEDNGREYIMDNGRPDKLRRRGIVPAQEYNPFYP